MPISKITLVKCQTNVKHIHLKVIITHSAQHLTIIHQIKTLKGEITKHITDKIKWIIKNISRKADIRGDSDLGEVWAGKKGAE